MKTKTYNTYSFAELSGPAREKAIEDHRQYIGEQWDGECTIEDAKQMLVFAGFTVKDILYSGFWSQGDGACFTGSWQASKVSAAQMRDNAPVDAELHRVADGLAVLAAKFPHSSFTVRQFGRYLHEYCTEFIFSLVDENGDELPDSVVGDGEKDLTTLARDAMRWIYRGLEKEYDYQTAEAQVIESIEANGYEFTANGKLD